MVSCNVGVEVLNVFVEAFGTCVEQKKYVPLVRNRAPFRVNLNERSIFRKLVKALPFMEILTDIKLFAKSSICFFNSFMTEVVIM